jgi:hypothetical protein
VAERGVGGEPFSALEIPDLGEKYREIARIGGLRVAGLSNSGPSRRLLGFALSSFGIPFGGRDGGCGAGVSRSERTGA